MTRRSAGAGLLVVGIAAGLRPIGAADQFKAGVDVVQLTVAVTDGKKVVADLGADDFEVLDNGVAQPILGVTRETLPIDITLVLDTSESLTESLASALANAAERIRSRLEEADRLSVVTFNQRIQQRLALQPAGATRAIALGAPAGQTALNDAIAVVLTQRATADRRQMAIVFTDGFDSISLLREDDVLSLAGRSSTALFLVSRASGGSGTALSAGLGTIVTPTHRQPVEFFERLAAATGGISQIVPEMTETRTTTGSGTTIQLRPNVNLLEEPFLRALDDFRSSYTIRYSLTGVPRPGWHTVAVRVVRPRNRYVVRTRTGYSGG